MHQRNEGAADHPEHCNVADEIEIELIIQCRVDRGGRIKTEQRMAVGRRTHDGFGGNIACCAGPILDHEWLAELLCERLSYQADEDVSAPTGGIAYDPAYGSRWISLRPSKARRHRQRGSAGGQLQKFAAGKFHLRLPKS